MRILTSLFLIITFISSVLFACDYSCHKADKNHQQTEVSVSEEAEEACHQNSATQAQCGIHCTHSSIFIEFKTVVLPNLEAQDINNPYIFFHTQIYLEGLFRPPLV